MDLSNAHALVPIQVCASSHDLLLEVTSGESLAACKSVMDSLIVGMCEAGLVGSDGVLSVEQGRVMEEGGSYWCSTPPELTFPVAVWMSADPSPWPKVHVSGQPRHSL